MYCNTLQMAPTQERCPVCRLYLLPDMLLSEHLDTHPKDQVILALTNLVERQRSSSNSSPWITVTKPSSTVINSSQSSENIRLDWADNSIRAPNWPKVQEESWVGNRSSVLASSSRTAYWQSHQSTEYGSESRFNTPSFNYSYTKRDSHQLIRPVTRKHENIQKNSTTIPVIQRIEHSNNDVRPLPSPTSNYKYNDYSEHQGVYDRLNTMEQNDNLVDNQGCTSEKSFNIETVEIDVPSVVCMNNEISRLQSINISSDKALRRDVIIQPVRSRIPAVDTTPIIDSLLSSTEIHNAHSSNTKNNQTDYLSKENQTKSLKHSKEEIICKQNIEIISHSVVSNPKSFKNTDVSSLIVKQKNEELNGLHEISTYENSNLINNNENLQGWKEFSQGDSDEKLLYSDELDDEKSFETNSESVYDSDHRKTMFSPNLVIINLETNNEKLDSPEKLLDIDICQPNLRSGPVYVKPKNDKEDKQTDKYKKINCTEIESYPDQSNFDHSNMPTEEFSSHCGSKINTSDNLKQNLDCSLSSESLNIRTDEKMPARGELSEQESTDSSSWAYQNACSSFPLNLPVDENELNLSQYLSPMLEPSSSCSLVNHIDGSRSSKSNSTIKQLNIFKCPHCTDEFVCAKERRVHISRCHPTQTTHTFEHNESLRNSFEFSEDYYTHNSSNHNDQNNISNIEHVEVDCQTKCDNFNSSLLVSSMNIINNTDAILEPLEDMHIEMKNTDIKTDFNSFNLNQQDTFTDTNIKMESNISGQSTSKKIVKRTVIRKRITAFTYTCIICQEEFKTTNSFNKHLEIHPLECRLCAKLFTKKKTFDDHEATHVGFKKYACTKCPRRFHSDEKLKKHECKSTSSKIFKCTACDARFQGRKALVQHKISMHKFKPPEKIYFCHCGENFPSFAKLFYHKETHDTKPKNCKYCTQKFIHIISLNRHIRTAHNDKTIENSEKCQICNKSLSKHSIRSHMKIHTGNNIYNCFICNKNFSTKWNLKQHKYVHQNRSTKPHKCQLCPSAFIRLQDYKYHMNSHKKVYSFVCNQCGRRFIRKYNYLRHVKEHEQEKKYQCTITGCTKVFHRKYYLTEHMRTHTGTRPFVCTICSKTSSTKSNHNKHLKIHHANTRDSINVEN